jgi:hypothetical protein
MRRKMEATQEHGGAVTSLQASFFFSYSELNHFATVRINYGASYLACLSGLKLPPAASANYCIQQAAICREQSQFGMKKRSTSE